MANRALVVVDMQKDFVDGALGTKEAVEIVPKVIEKIKNFDGIILVTKDTHQKDYLKTQEGKNLPVEHCIKGTEGWKLFPDIELILKEKQYVQIFLKPTFGSTELAGRIRKLFEKKEIESVEFVGLCTGICVMSNAMLAKAYSPEIPITVDAACCACVTPESHKTALEAMKLCQIKIENE